MNPTRSRSTTPPSWGTSSQAETAHLLLRFSRRLSSFEGDSNQSICSLPEDDNKDKAKGNGKETPADEAFVELASNAESELWHGAFTHFFLETQRPETDDLLFFIKQKALLPSTKKSSDDDDNPNPNPNPNQNQNDENDENDPLFVRRNHPNARATLPSRWEPLVDWEESFFLNVICNCFQYTLSFAVCAKKTASVVRSVSASMNSAVHRDSGESISFLRRWRVLHCITKRVYATPSRARMDGGKAQVHTTTYPEIYFAIDDFEDVFRDAVVHNRGEYVCVEISAVGALHPSYPSREVTVFQGAVGYDILKSELNSKSETASASIFKNLFAKKTADPTFFSISGPGRKGKAQMALLPIYGEVEVKPQSESTHQQNLFVRLFGPKSEPPSPPLYINCSLISISLDWKTIIKDLMSTKMSPTIMSSVVSRTLQTPSQAQLPQTVTTEEDEEEEPPKADLSQTI